MSGFHLFDAFFVYTVTGSYRLMETQALSALSILAQSAMTDDQHGSLVSMKTLILLKQHSLGSRGSTVWGDIVGVGRILGLPPSPSPAARSPLMSRRAYTINVVPDCQYSHMVALSQACRGCSPYFGMHN